MSCRLCLNNLTDSISVAKYIDGEGTLVAEIIQKYLEILLNVPNDKICFDCFKHLKDFYEFCLVVEQKQNELRLQQAENEKLTQSAGRTNKKLRLTVDDEYEMKIKVETNDINIANDSLNVACELDPLDLLSINQEKQESPDHHQEFLLEENFTIINANTVLDDIPVEFATDAEATDSNEIDSNAGTEISKNDSNEKRKYISCVVAAEMRRNARNAFIAEQHGTLPCDICAQSFENFDLLMGHFREEHKTKGYAKCCQKRFSRRYEFIDHLKWHQNPNSFSCLFCNRTFANIKGLKLHNDSFHIPEGLQVHQCPECPRKFGKKSILKRHLSTHRSDKTQLELEHECKECNKRFKSSWILRNHQKNVHMKESVTICDICGKIFTTKANCESHRRFSHLSNDEATTNIKCPKCGRCFKHARSLYRHKMRDHRDNLPKEFACDVCGAIKSSKSTLRDHKRYHHTNATFKCTICDKERKTAKDLKEHMAMHTGVPNYKCEYCPKMFNCYPNKVKHKKLKHRDRIEEKN